ncbi:hypothetical protein TcG_13064 [Trypanosoma cruzi]|nr:hypothetical protein TcG_13064 [Trypanosoma cruzi]
MLRKGNHLFRYTLQPLFVNGLRAVRGDVASFSVLNGAVVREGVFPNIRMLSCRGRGIPTACAAGPPVDCRGSAAGGDCSRGVAEGLRLSLELAEVRCPSFAR